MGPCRSGNIRDILFAENISDFPETDHEESENLEDTAGDIESLRDLSGDNNSDVGLVYFDELADFSFGSNDNYIPNESDLETSDREEVQDDQGGRPRPSHSVSSDDDESVPIPRPNPKGKGISPRT